MPGPYGNSSIPFHYADFHGGINTKDSALLLTDNQARDLQNVQGTTAGAIVKRNGLVTFASPASTFTSLFAAESTPTIALVGAGGTSLFSVTTGGAVNTIKTGVGSNLRWETISAPVVSGQGPIYMMNGSDTPQQWSGATAGTATANWTNASGSVAVPNGKYCLYANNQVFVAGVSSAPSTVFISAIADPTNWDPASLTGASSVQFDPNDGQPITGLGRVGPYVAVFKPRKFFLITDPATDQTRRVSDSIGCVAHRSIATGSEGTYFLSEDRGVYVTNGTKITPISDIIQPTIDVIDGQKAQAAAAFFNGHYYLSVAGSGSAPNDTILDWDESLNSWWKHTFGSNQFAVWHPSISAQLYSAKSTSTIVDQCFVTGVNVDNGTAFKWRWAGPWQSPSFYRRRLFPTVFYKKRLRQVRFEGSGSIDYSMAFDFFTTEQLIASNLFGAGGSLFGGTGSYGVDGIFGDVPPVSQARLNSLGVHNAFSAVFSATSLTADEVISYTFMITDRKDSVV